MLKAVLESHPSIEKISIRFLVSGHSFLPNDSDFANIESALKHHQRIYVPEDYIQVMKNCRRKNRFIVTTMEPDDFWGTSELEKKICNRKTDVHKNKISWLAAREIMLLKTHPYSIFMKSNFDDNYSEIDIKKKQAGRPALGPPTSNCLENLIPLWP